MGVLSDELMAEHDRQRHKLFGFFAGEPEHHALVPCAFFVDTLGDIWGLLVDRDHNGAGLGIEAHIAVVVSDVSDDASDNFGDIDIPLGGHFARDDGHARRDHRFNRDAGEWVIGEHRVEDRI